MQLDSNVWQQHANSTFNFQVTSNSELRRPDCNCTQWKDSLLKITSTNNLQLIKFSRKYYDISPSHSEHLALFHVLPLGLTLSLKFGAETKLPQRVNKCLKWLLLLFYLCNIFDGIRGGYGLLQIMVGNILKCPVRLSLNTGATEYKSWSSVLCTILW
jgi:hypothetical protein